MKKLCLLILSIFCLSNFINLSAQESSLTLNVGADVMSRYIFRGTDYGNSPSIQPLVSLKCSNFEIGYWGAIATNSFYQEIDLYAKYSIGNLSFIFTDYYIPSITGTPASPDTRYFVFEDKTTAHTFEGAVAYQFGESFPLKLFGSVFFYGNDKRWGFDEEKDSNEDTYFSSYLEIGYPFSIKGNTLDLFMGFTPTAGAFGNTMGVVNLGVTATKNVKVTESFTLPVKSSLIYNPQLSNVHFVFGLTF
jgi:hypothetical protein